jgi:hypothetical protein
MYALFGLGLAQSVAGRRERLAYHVKHGPLVGSPAPRLMNFFAACLLHSMNRRKVFRDETDRCYVRQRAGVNERTGVNAQFEIEGRRRETLACGA